MRFKKILSTILTVALTSTVVYMPIQEQSSIDAKAAVSSTSDTYNGNDLGCTYTPTKSTFKVWAPTANKVQIKRYTTGSDAEAGASVIETKDMTYSGSGVWSITISGDLKNTYYTYLVDGRETPDVYGRTTGINGDRSMVIDLDSTDPEGWENDKRVDSPNQTDAIVWEVHVKDFSYDSNSGISEANRGKFLAFTEEGTTYMGDGVTKTGIDYLKELGVTHVQILPMYDYASVDERNSGGETFNWGYDPKNYNVPEGSYSTNPYDGNSRVKELKEMVKALHDAGIGVVMDVVYNHTYAPFGQGGSQNEFQKQQYSPLERTVPGYYYTSTDWSGCGNSTDSTKPMYRKYMIDSIVYWATEYHLDGFRFDLMGIHDIQTMNEIRAALNKIDPSIKIWGEPWCGDGSKNNIPGYANKSNVKSLDNNIAVFSDNARDAIKGNTWDGKLSNAGWVTGNGARQTEVIAGIKAQCGDYGNINNNIWSKQPSQVITYTSCHDNHALYDILCMSTSKSQNGQRYDDVVAMNRVAASLVLTSQGASFFQAGEEFARTKYGDHNSYQSSASINKLDWSRAKNYSDLVSYYKGLIEIRKNFSAFRDPTTSAGNRIQWLTTPGSQQIAYSLTNNVSGEWSKVVCLFNVSSNSSTINLPSGNWVIIAKDDKAGVQSLGTASGSVQVSGRSSMILVEKNSFDNTVIGKTGTVVINHVDESGNLIKTETKTGKEGTSYTTSAMSSDEYNLVSTPSNASGRFIDGTITVTYTYKKDTTPRGTVTIKYIDKATNTEIATSETKSGKQGTSYSTTAKTIKGYDLLETPSNANGTYTSGNIEVVYYYVEKEVKCLTVNYYNANNWSNVYLYAYDESSGTAKLFTGAWPGKAMNNDGNGWWSLEVPETEAAQIIFTNNAGSQEPSGVGSGGYTAEGEVWVKNGIVLGSDPDNITGKVIVNYVDTKGNTIATSSTLSGKVGSSYSTTPKTISGYTLKTIPSNARGTYTRSDITVTYIYEEDEKNPPVVNSFTTDKASPQVSGTTVKLTVNATGEGTLQYKFLVKDSKGNWYVLKDYSSINTYSWKTGATGTKTLYVDVKDSNGLVTRESISYKVLDKIDPPKISSFVADKVSPQVTGTKVTLTAKATGSGTLQYKFLIKDSKGNWYIIKNYSTSNTAVWTTGATGTKTLYVDVKDSNGNVVRKEMSYKVSEKVSAPVVNSFKVDNESQTIGTPVVLLANATGSGALQYKFIVQDSKGNWTKIQDYSTSNMAVWIPSVAGTNKLYVDVRDSSGNVTRKELVCNVKEKVSVPVITGFITDKASPQTTGTPIVLLANATGTGTLKYKFIVQDSKGNWTKIQDYSTSNMAVWVPSIVGTNKLYVDVKDSNGNVVREEMIYKIK